MPSLQTPENAMDAVAVIVRNMAEGNLSPSEANSWAKLAGTFLRAVESSDMLKRIEKLEQSLKT
jgi:hypothetical protein